MFKFVVIPLFFAAVNAGILTHSAVLAPAVAHAPVAIATGGHYATSYQNSNSISVGAHPVVTAHAAPVVAHAPIAVGVAHAAPISFGVAHAAPIAVAHGVGLGHYGGYGLH